MEKSMATYECSKCSMAVNATCAKCDAPLGIQLGISSIFLAAVLALIPAVYGLVKKQEIETPFIPFLSLGLFVTLITGFNLFQVF